MTSRPAPNAEQTAAARAALTRRYRAMPDLVTDANVAALAEQYACREYVAGLSDDRLDRIIADVWGDALVRGNAIDERLVRRHGAR